MRAVKRLVVSANRRLRPYGIDLVAARAHHRALRRFRHELADYRQRCHALGLAEPADADLLPMLGDRDAAAGIVDPHYFNMDLWAAQRVYALAPREHIDVGSRLDGFISHLLVFRTVTVWDIRPLPTPIDGVRFVQADATNLAGIADDSVESLSSLHAIEHFGPGRYGDPLDPTACGAALRAFARVLAPGGRLLLAFPVGRPRTQFNGQRVLDPVAVLAECAPLELVEFSAVGDDGVLRREVDPHAYRDARNACGLFELTKPRRQSAP